jgi:phytoene synthase
MGETRALTGEMRELARTLEPDRYLAALLSPRAARDDLIALAAFVAELKRIPKIVSDPHLAEIRLAWWRDALLAGDGAATGNPQADAMRAMIARHALDRGALAAWLDALTHTFYSAPPDDEAHLDLELSLIEGTPFVFAAHLCGATADADLDAACRAAGIAYGLARRGLEFPRSLARGRVPLPGLLSSSGQADVNALTAVAARTRLEALAPPRVEAAKSTFAKLEWAGKAALLPIALVEPYLRASCDQGHDLTRELADVAPLTRVWRLWRAHMTGHV